MTKRRKFTPEFKAMVPGTVLHVEGDGVSYTATVGKTPFHDPSKSRTHA